MKTEKVFPETLLQLMLDVLNKSPNFKYINGIQPFMMSFAGKKYYVYVKNLSSAYFKERPDTTRAQLPIKPEFDEIKQSEIPFIFLGYDQINDVIVCWNYHVVKERLNEKKSVSFYSRSFFQEEVISGEFLRKKLKNGDEPILFKRKDLALFFERISTFFFSSPISEDDDTKDNPFTENGKIFKIIEEDLLKQLEPIVNAHHTLEAIKITEQYYKGKYPNMKIKDWSMLVKNAFNSKNTEAIYPQMEEPQSFSSEELSKDELNNPFTGKKKTYILRVEFPNGQVVENRNVSKTLIDVINYAGIEPVRNLGIIINNVNLISTTIIPKYEKAQKNIGKGLYVMTCCDTNKKKKIIEQISNSLNLNLNVIKVYI